MSSFLSLGIRKDLVQSLNEIKIENPTIIQEKAIPILLGPPTDFIGLAQTGTGKTAAFGLPAIQNLNFEVSGTQVLILSPTRELVLQIKKQLFKFTKYAKQRVFFETVYGGEKIEKQISRLERPNHILIATPGRLVDLIARKKVDIRTISTVILDEADEMLSMGFKKELDSILKTAPASKKTWLFSATMPDGIQQIVNQFMSSEAEIISVKKNAVNENISHYYVRSKLEEKTRLIGHYLKTQKGNQGIIFARTKLGAQKLKEELSGFGFNVDALEGNMQQKEREKVMRAFKNGNLQFLISTDVSARGIDVQNLAFVIHHQLPKQLEYYTHRSGRTARAGNTGVSLAFILNNELEFVRKIESKLDVKFQEFK